MKRELFWLTLPVIFDGNVVGSLILNRAQVQWASPARGPIPSAQRKVRHANGPTA